MVKKVTRQLEKAQKEKHLKTADTQKEQDMKQADLTQDRTEEKLMRDMKKGESEKKKNAVKNAKDKRERLKKEGKKLAKTSAALDKLAIDERKSVSAKKKAWQQLKSLLRELNPLEGAGKREVYLNGVEKAKAFLKKDETLPKSKKTELQQGMRKDGNGVEHQGVRVCPFCR